MKPTMMTYINEEEEMCRVILADFQTNAEKLESLRKKWRKRMVNFSNWIKLKCSSKRQILH